LAPAIFESRKLCEVIASDDKLLMDRIVRVSLHEVGISGGSSQLSMFTTLRFRIKGVSGTEANSVLLGHEISSSFMRTFARRGKSLIHQVVDGETKDNEGIRLKIIAVTGAGVSANTKRNLRALIVEECKNYIASKGFDEAIQDVIYGRLSSKVFSRLKQITKMRRVEVRKSERTETFK